VASRRVEVAGFDLAILVTRDRRSLRKCC
jgi:hypothetical protein